MKSVKAKPYRVINWGINSDKIEFYDIMPYLVGEWEEMKKEKKDRLKNLKRHKERDFEAEEECKKMPETFEEIKKFILDISLYRFWGRCEYEVIICDWPCQKHEYKLDIYEQIKNNIDVITEHFIKEVCDEKNS